MHTNRDNIILKPLTINGYEKYPFIISGPCSAETEEQVFSTAEQLVYNGITNYRAGVWKPRTKPGDFEGNGEIALQWLQQVKHKYNLKIATEAATTKHIELCLKYDVDIIWIGARTTTNPFLVQNLADVLKGNDITVLVKNPVNPDIELWIGALERLNNAGIQRLAAIHRGFSNYGVNTYRNAPMWQIPIELRKRFSKLPIICDPSHIGGKRELIQPISQLAMDLGFDGLFVESHIMPDKAWSDAKQQVTPNQLKEIINNLIIRNNYSDNNNIMRLRERIDYIDSRIVDIIAERIALCKEIGEYKKQNNITVLQPQRYNDMINNLSLKGKTLSLDEKFINSLFEIIHQKSVEEQIKIMNKK